VEKSGQPHMPDVSPPEKTEVGLPTAEEKWWGQNRSAHFEEIPLVLAGN